MTTFFISALLTFWIGLFVLQFFINRKAILKYFENGNCIVTGHKGKGKDLLFSYVTNARKREYISNLDYTNGVKRIEFEFKTLSVGGNDFVNFAENTLKKYVYPYADKVDYYISDCGVYMPSTYHDELCKRYRDTPFFMALSRHLGDCNVHCNIQNLNRLWDKVREQGDYYIDCLGSKVFGRLCVQKIRVYDNYETALARKCPVKIPRRLVLNSQRAKDLTAVRTADTGLIRDMFIIHKLPKKPYNTRIFKEKLKNA